MSILLVGVFTKNRRGLKDALKTGVNHPILSNGVRQQAIGSAPSAKFIFGSRSKNLPSCIFQWILKDNPLEIGFFAYYRD
jgi:hypothetical protein